MPIPHVLAPAIAAASRVEARAIAALSQALGDGELRPLDGDRMSMHARLIAAEERLDLWLDGAETSAKTVWLEACLKMQRAHRRGWRASAADLGSEIKSLATPERMQALAQLAAPLKALSPGPAPATNTVFGVSATVGLTVMLAVAPVERSALGAGQITAEGATLPVTHPEGGLVARVSVREGQEVRAGDLLIQLQPIAGIGDRDSLRMRAAGLALAKTRLIALMEGGKPDFSSDAELHPARARAESALFAAERAALNRDTLRLDNRANAHRAALDAIAAEQENLRVQLTEWMGDRNLTPQRAMMADLVMAQARGRLGQLERRAEAARAAIAVAETERTEVLADRRRAWLAELEEVSAELYAVDQALLQFTARDADLEVRAPAGGRVQWLMTPATGIAVSAGAPLVHILPSDAALVAEVWTAEADARAVKAGDPVRVRLEGAQQRTEIGGLITTIAANPDRFKDGVAYRRMLVALNPPDSGAEGADVRAFMAPGAAVTVEIAVREDSLLQQMARAMIAPSAQASTP